jgi:hypothetical protein
MLPLRHSQTIHATPGNRYVGDLSYIAKLHGGHLRHRLNRHQPYNAHMLSHQTVNTVFPSHGNITLPSALLDKIKGTQEAAVNITTQRKDASRLKEFLSFCADDSLPAREEVLLAWASSYAGRLAGKTVGAKLLAIRKEHERRGLIWYGRNCLHSILKGVRNFAPLHHFIEKGFLSRYLC